MVKKKMGRPTDSVKENTIKFRADDQLKQKFEYCKRVMNKDGSFIIRSLINELYDKLTQEDNV